MAGKDNKIKLQDGSISYAADVVATVAGLAVAEVEGIAGMSGNLVSGFTELMGKKDFTKGVKVEINENDAKIDIFVNVHFGTKIQKVCREVQESVRKAIETMTSLNVLAVNVHVQGIYSENPSDK
ncbi:MAG TPA: Asp23/Gls24 family envelope stress response protein [Clostridia bacterium]|nr:Asp23/Gls24 family envelope stress response protein [Clostridia bacterium]